LGKAEEGNGGQRGNGVCDERKRGWLIYLSVQISGQQKRRGTIICKRPDKIRRDQARSGLGRSDNERTRVFCRLHAHLPTWTAHDDNETDDSHSRHDCPRRCSQLRPRTGHNQRPHRHRHNQLSRHCRPDDDGSTSAAATAAIPANSDTSGVMSKSPSGE
jgi:hypothetical protein